MYRPGGFPEYTPTDQKIFDKIVALIRGTFEQHLFQHIWTPAVEKNEILLKGGETIANEIFGLISTKPMKGFIQKMTEIHKNMTSSLAIAKEEKISLINKLLGDRDSKAFLENLQKSELERNALDDDRDGLNDELIDIISELKKEGIKDYSLHFDLTVPFARYTLDHLSELTFPFKRYQIQPVWRGERQQRGRFKEFRQCDVDCIWRSESAMGSWYGVETIFVLQKALDTVFRQFGLEKTYTTHISHRGVTTAFLEKHLGHDQEKISAVLKLLDNYHKKEPAVFEQELRETIGDALATEISSLIQSKDYTRLQSIDGYTELAETIQRLKQLGSPVVYDFTIVRGLGYYTGIVFETFVGGDASLGSICSGGGYEDFTRFIDPKNVFSGIGGSIGLSRLMEIVAEKQKDIIMRTGSLFVHFEETLPEILTLYQHLLAQGKSCELYPTAAKFTKQLEYADKKGIAEVIILGVDELQQKIYKIKNLETGTEESIALR